MNGLKSPTKYVVEVAKARSDPLYFIKNILGDTPYPKQEEIIRRFYSGDYRKLVWVSGMRCVHEDTEVMTQYGAKKIKDLQEGVDLVLQWDFRRKKAVFDTFILHNVGKKKLYSVKLSNGRTIIASEDHEFLTDQGFVKLGELNVGDYIAVPKGGWTYHDLSGYEDYAIVIAMLIAEGSLTSSNFEFTHANNEMVERISNIVEKYDCELNKYGRYYIRSKSNKRFHGRPINKLRNHCKYIGLYGKKSVEKEIPASIYVLDRHSRFAFVDTYSKTDGWDYGNTVELYTSSEKLAKGLHWLLLSVGIPSYIHTKKKNKKRKRDTYTVVFLKKPSSNSKIYVSPVCLKNHPQKSVLKHKYGFSTENNLRIDTVERLASVLKDDQYINFVAQFYWVRIEAIEYYGEGHTYDLSTPNENYIAEGVIVHNSGKSRLAAWIAAYELFSLCTLSDPAKHYGLSKGSRITINIVATSTDTADDAVFGHIVHLMKYNDFINEVVNLEFRKDFIFCEDKNVKLQLLSSWTNTAVGRTSKLVVFDEISYFEENTGKRGAWEIYTRLSKSTDTLGKHGKVIAISSPKHPNDIIMTLAKNYQDDPSALVYITPTWEVNPNLTFESLWEEHKHNPAEFWRDYGCKPTITTMLEFPDGVKLEGENKALLHDHIDHSYLRVLAIDPAVRNDAFGLAFGYLSEDGTVVVDGAYRFTREIDQPFISPREIKEYLKDIILRYNIFAVVFDTWMYPELIEWMRDDLGLIVVQHIVKKEDYDRWKEMQDEGTVKVCEYDVLRKEAESLLVINDKRVDHPYGGCFTGDTRVSLLDGTEPTFEELRDRFGKNEVFYVYSVDQNGIITVGEGRNPRITRTVDEIVELLLDNYQVIRCTPDHLFLTLDGYYIAAKDIEPNTPLFPLYRSYCNGGGWRGYDRIWQPYSNRRELVHHMVAKAYGILPEDSKDLIIHHIDGNKRNNVPQNLEAVTRSEHSRKHACERYYNDKEFAEKFRRACLQYVKSERGRQISRETIIKNMSKVLAARKPSQKNHRVISKRIIRGNFDVWDITVEPYHNFALTAGVFVHNSKDVSDCVANVIWMLTQNNEIQNASKIKFSPSHVRVF